MTDLSALPTPALILDARRLRASCERMRAKCRSLGVGLRPHMKTLKSIEAARIAIDPGHGGIAVSTLKEAEYFADHGIGDIQYAVCITPDKLARAAALTARIERFSVFVDSAEAARATARHNLRAWIEIDSGQHRTGVLPGSDDLVDIARALGGSLAGVATHGGQSYHERNPEKIAAVAEDERHAVIGATDRLRQAGFEVGGVSAGSTPTAVHARSGAGLTELRPGVYMAGDLFQAAIGSLGIDDIAVSVLATVISHGRAPDRIFIDAGALALSKDRSTAALDDGDKGYGLVVDVDGRAAFGALLVAGVNQEHGEIRIDDPALFARLPIGARVRILPNHACMTTAMYDSYHVIDEAEAPTVWSKTGGW